jgi:hypothetical protein
MKTIQISKEMKKFIVSLFVVGLFGCKTPPDATPAQQQSSQIVLVAPLPYSLTINGQRWLLRDKEEIVNDGADGMTDCAAHTIWYSFEVDGDKSVERETIWHEIFHAGNCEEVPSEGTYWQRVTFGDAQHQEVYKLGQFMPSFVHDNPEFMAWAEDWSS